MKEICSYSKKILEVVTHFFCELRNKNDNIIENKNIKTEKKLPKKGVKLKYFWK